MPEYGRSIQKMVDMAVQMADRAERQQCANTIVKIMSGILPATTNKADDEHRLWNHLARIAHYKLDIDYPYEIVPQDHLESRPKMVHYPSSKIHYLHYGRTLETLIKAACEFEEGIEKDNIIALIANHMRKSYTAWNKDMVEDQKIIDDLYQLSDGKLTLTPEILQLMQKRMGENIRKPSGGNKNNGKAKMSNKNNRKRFDSKR